MVYMNTNLTWGAGEFVVTAIGMATEVGHISGMLHHHPGVRHAGAGPGRRDHETAAVDRNPRIDLGEQLR